MSKLQNSSELRPAMASNGSSAPDPQQRKPVDNNNCSSARICSITTQPRLRGTRESVTRHVTRVSSWGRRVTPCSELSWAEVTWRIRAHFCGVIRLYTSNTVICTFYMSQKSQKCDLSDSVFTAGAGDGVSSCQCPGRCVMQPNGLLITLQRSHQPRLNTN